MKNARLVSQLPQSPPREMRSALVSVNLIVVTHPRSNLALSLFLLQVASPSYMPTGSRCARYENQACCTAELAMR